MIGSLGTEVTTGLVTVEEIVDRSLEWFVSTKVDTVLALAVVATLLHLADRAKLHCLFAGTPGTWHWEITMSFSSLQHGEHGLHMVSMGSS